MTRARIVLSCLLLPGLLACAADPVAATADDEPIVASGIGTSPSACVDVCDPEGIGETARLAPEPGVAPASCGVWFDVSTAAADARALACMPPDAVVHAAGHSTCSDALQLAGLRPSLAVVRHLAYNGSAIQATCNAPVPAYMAPEQAHPPIVAPAMMMEWRAPAPWAARAPLQAGFPLAPILGFLLSEKGMTLISAAALWLWHKAVKDEKRRKTIAEYAGEAFDVAEAAGLTQQLDGHGKYKVFITTIIDALKADQAREPTGKEMAALQEMAKRWAWMGKLPAATARPPLPLPPPPRG